MYNEAAQPMLGHRGCRLGLPFPDIYRMQVEAIIAAGAQLAAGASKCARRH